LRGENLKSASTTTHKEIFSVTSVTTGQPNGKPEKERNRAYAIFCEKWDRQVTGDKEITLAFLKVANALRWHFNRKSGGIAFPGMGTLADSIGVSVRTVIRATEWLEGRGHVEVTRRRSGKKNLVNHYKPILKAAAEKPEQSANTVSLGSDKAMSLGSDKAMSPKPLTEPLTEPLTLCKYIGPVSTGPLNKGEAIKEGREERGIRGSRESENPPSVSPFLPRRESISEKCWRLAGEYEGCVGRTIVGKAWRHRPDPADLLADIEQAIETGDDLGYALSRYWQDEWKTA
jgi:hypothetical protein